MEQHFVNSLSKLMRCNFRHFANQAGLANLLLRTEGHVDTAYKLFPNSLLNAVDELFNMHDDARLAVYRTFIRLELGGAHFGPKILERARSQFEKTLRHIARYEGHKKMQTVLDQQLEIENALLKNAPQAVVANIALIKEQIKFTQSLIDQYGQYRIISDPRNLINENAQVVCNSFEFSRVNEVDKTLNFYQTQQMNDNDLMGGWRYFDVIHSFNHIDRTYVFKALLGACLHLLELNQERTNQGLPALRLNEPTTKFACELMGKLKKENPEMVLECLSSRNAILALRQVQGIDPVESGPLRKFLAQEVRDNRLTGNGRYLAHKHFLTLQNIEGFPTLKYQKRELARKRLARMQEKHYETRHAKRERLWRANLGHAALTYSL